MLRSLVHYRRANLAVVAAAAVATAVLCGALLVGSSLQASLRALTLDRLGTVDFAIVRNRLFGQTLAQRIQASGERLVAVPTLILRGSAVEPNTRARASGVSIYGANDSFDALWNGATRALRSNRRPILPPVLINIALAQELGIALGDPLLLSFESHGELPRGSLLAGQDIGDALRSLRLEVVGILPTEGIGRFGLSARQDLPRNAFVRLEDLQRALGRGAEVNAILIDSGPDNLDATSIALAELLEEKLRLEDIGLDLVEESDTLRLESREFILSPPVVQAALQIERAEPALPVFTYLANTLERGERTLPYSTIAAFDPPHSSAQDAALGSLHLTSGELVESLGDSELLLNRWAAEDLEAEPGDEIRVTYYAIGEREELHTETAILQVRGVVEMSGLAAERSLTPEFPGISDAQNMADWEPPFPIRLGLIRPRDEDYWETYRGTPKAFVSRATGIRLWSSRFGDTTSVRFAAAATQRIRTHLDHQLSFQDLGFRIQPVRQQGLAASSGATDFSGLFLGFSLFLIVSALLLVGLLFRLLVEGRSKELGIRLATGFPPRQVLGRFLAEGGVLSMLGTLGGAGLALIYGRWLIAQLQSWWSSLIDSPFLRFEISWPSLALGLLLSNLLVWLSMALAVRKLSRLPARQLLAGSTRAAIGSRGSNDGLRSRRIALVALILATVLFATAWVADDSWSVGLFFGVGALLCTSGLAAFSFWCRAGQASRASLNLASMAARDSAWNPGRSFLSVTLVASACFVLVSVTANRRDPGGETQNKASGTGGFQLVAESDTPLPKDPSDTKARSELGFSAEGESLMASTQIFPLRLLPGDDASCLNLYQPESPRILGAPAAFRARGGFRFRQTTKPAENPWLLLDEDLGEGVIPAIGDYNSVRWILHLGLGKELQIQDELGRALSLRIVGLLDTSIFQSELLISEENFLHHFPSRSGFSYFLAEAPTDSSPQLTAAFEEALSPYGLDAKSTAEKLAAYQAVEHMYLSTFQALGGFGLLLGTLGLGVVLVRNIYERRGELATLRAFGYSRATLAVLVVIENALLLCIGIGIGSLAGLVAVGPHLLESGNEVPWVALGLTLSQVFAAGLLASVVAVFSTLKIPLVATLKSEAI